MSDRSDREAAGYIEIPFPLDTGDLAYLWLPRLLTESEAWRFQGFVDALAVERVMEGDTDGD